VYVTGAGGFVGRHVAAAFRAAGHEVRDRRVDLLDLPGLDAVIAGCDAVVNVAARYSYEDDGGLTERVNVDGTRNVLAACVRAGAALLHTSTAGTCGPVEGRPATELDTPPDWELTVPYKASKLRAEALVLSAAQAGDLRAVVVCPTTPIGPGDDKPTPTGTMIEGVASGKVPAYIAGTGLNLVDVRDVAQGHVLALDRGASGEKYLLGGVDLPLREVFARIAHAAGRPAPRIRIPYALPKALAAARLLNRHEVTLARLPMYFSSEKAKRALGYAPGDIGPAVEDATAEALARVALRRRPSRAATA
jgi:dihydroflavonol-4-reductase